MKVYQRHFTQVIPVSVDKVWRFFSRPENLNVLTPDDMNFEILSDVEGVPMYPGMMISYKVSPFKGISMNWLTEITQISEHNYFIDEQRSGPYRLWHHQHHFKEIEQGTEMKDILHYAIPYGPIGQLANAMIVAKRIDDIFGYRFEAVKRLF